MPEVTAAKTRRLRCWPALVAAALVAAGASAEDWPQWRGPARTGVTRERSGYPDGWPPRRLWRRDVGVGCTSPVIAAGRVYVMGWHGRRGRGNPVGRDVLYCLDAATGREHWKRSYPCRYQGRLRVGDLGAYGGPSSTPTYDGATGRLYTLSIDGEMRCWDARDGRTLWTKDLHAAYTIRRRPDAGGGRRDYGHTGSPLVLGDDVIVEVGATEGTLMAFDKATGRRRWASECREPAGHSAGPTLVSVGERDALAHLTLHSVVVVQADGDAAGRTIARMPWRTNYANNIPSPAAAGDDGIVVTSSYDRSRTCLLRVGGRGLTARWRSREHAKVGSPVVGLGRIFLVHDRLRCLDLATGELQWRGGSFGHGTCLLAAGDDKLIVFGTGRLTVLDPAADDYRELASVREVVRGTCYPQVALADGRIYCKDRDGHLVCLSVRPGEKPPGPEKTEGTGPRTRPAKRRN